MFTAVQLRKGDAVRHKSGIVGLVLAPERDGLVKVYAMRFSGDFGETDFETVDCELVARGPEVRDDDD